MSTTEQLERLLRKYYGYVADLEGAGVEILDLLAIRDQIQLLLEQSTPESVLSQRLYNQVYQLDDVFWRERDVFLQVIGGRELRHARLQRQSPRSHWWWYLDQLKASPRVVGEPGQWLARAFAPAG
ncbi:MAG: hypothetical protein WAW03_16615 [Anaerolineae bacterium]|nr:hypothetical protein [Anaerolineae bacterium]